MQAFLTRAKRPGLSLYVKICVPAFGAVMVVALGARTAEAQTGQWRASGDSIYYDAGPVGIGTTGPNYPMEVVAPGTQLRLANTLSNGGMFLYGFRPDHFSVAGGASHAGGHGSNWTARATQAGIIASWDGGITFSGNTGLTVDSAFSPTPRMTITPGGNVGIGTLNPQAKLDVAGNIKTSGEVYTYHYTEDDFALSGDVYSRDIVTGMRMNAIEVSGGGNGPVAGNQGRHWGFGGRVAFGYATAAVGTEYPCAIDVTRSAYPPGDAAEYPTITCTATGSGYTKVTLQIPVGDGAGGDWDIYIRQLSPAH